MTSTTTNAANHRDISLAKLTLWTGNVRRTGAKDGLDELAASIAAHGLLNPLTVCMGPNGRFPVVAGQRRLLALRKLAKDGTISGAARIACVVRGNEADLAELSLAENVVRTAMHPADQFAAWSALIEKGASLTDIATRFGVAESTVRKRMALARVSPVIFALYRDGVIDLEALQAFTVTDDHALQERVWSGLCDWQRDNPRAIRAALTEADVPCSDKRVRLIGLDAYEAAGGIVRRDLFDPQEGGYVQDAALLDRLVTDRLTAIAREVEAEGWSWVEVRPSFDWIDRQAFALAEPEDDEADEPAWSEAVRAQGGAVVTLGYDGAAVERGLIREDAAPAPDDEALPEAEPDADQGGSPVPASLIEDLTAQKTAALRIELARSPDVALALTVHAMASSVFYRAGGGVLDARLTTRTLQPSIRDHAACPALIALDAERERIGDLLPGDHAALWDWCLAAERAVLLDVLAVAVAHGLDAVVTRSDANRAGVEHGHALAAALNLDMTHWYRPTASGYFGRISKDAILADLAEARQNPNAPLWAKLKKADLAALAERETAATPWLPAPLR